jgi:hypothetical protein
MSHRLPDNWPAEQVFNYRVPVQIHFKVVITDRGEGIVRTSPMASTSSPLRKNCSQFIDAETAGDFRGMHISTKGGATVTHYNADGEVVTLSPPANERPQGCSFSGKQFPGSDSILSKIVRTEIDFGSGVTITKDTIEITRAGKIVIERSGDKSNMTETTTFEHYSVNGNVIEGTKVRFSTFDEATGDGSSNTSVTNGSITFADGRFATWTSERSRVSKVVLGDDGRPESGEIVTEVLTQVTLRDGTVLYRHESSKPLTENLACEGRRRGPVSGTIETTYVDDDIVIDFGDGSCVNRTVTITVNGVTNTKTIGG